MRKLILAALVVVSLGGGTLASAQLRLPPIPRVGPRGLPPPPMTIEMLQADLIAKTGSDMVYFARNSHGITPAGQATLVAQARWMLANPSIRARIEGHADDRTPRDYALALGERRADAVRDFLVLQGVQPGRRNSLQNQEITDRVGPPLAERQRIVARGAVVGMALDPRPDRRIGEEPAGLGDERRLPGRVDAVAVAGEIDHVAAGLGGEVGLQHFDGHRRWRNAARWPAHHLRGCERADAQRG